MTNLMHNYFLYIYLNSLHVSSNPVLIIRRINCINTSSGVCQSLSVTVSCAGRKGIANETVTDTEWHILDIYLFQFSTRFQQPRAYHQENQLYPYIVWYMSICVGDRFVCRSERNCKRNGHRHRVTYNKYIFISILYTFRATPCSSSGE